MTAGQAPRQRVWREEQDCRVARPADVTAGRLVRLRVRRQLAARPTASKPVSVRPKQSERSRDCAGREGMGWDGVRVGVCGELAECGEGGRYLKKGAALGYGHHSAISHAGAPAEVQLAQLGAASPNGCTPPNMQRGGL